MLTLNNVEVKYINVILVLRGVSLELGEGGFICLLGANGAGKTTTLKAISGLLGTEEGKVSDGFVEFDGVRIDNKYPQEIARMGIVQVMEGRRIAEHLTVDENIKAGALVCRGDGGQLKRDLEAVYNYFPRLKEMQNATAGYCSGGEQQMMVTGRALMAHPKVVLLDEPSLGLSPVLVDEIAGIIKRINEEERIAILLVEQNARIALELASYGYVMENGRVVLDGPSDRLRDNEDVREFYLGLSEVGQKRSYREVKHYKRRKRWLG